MQPSNLRVSFFTILVLFCLPVISQDIKVYDTFDALNVDKFQQQSDSLIIINFWATWCKPCVKELPYFEQLLNYKFKIPSKITLVSLDRKQDMDSKVSKFILKNSIRNEVVLLADGRANDWIDKVDPSWSGSIPATVVFYHGKKLFFEKEFESMEELVHEIETIFK